MELCKTLLNEKPIDLKEDSVFTSYFLVGGDPEFARVVRGENGEDHRILDAREGMPYCKCGAGESSQCNCFRGYLPTSVGDMGLDGHTFIYEARPHARATPTDFVKNLGTIFNMVLSVEDPTIDIISLPQFRQRSLGGHVHFGVVHATDTDVHGYLHHGSEDASPCKWCLTCEEIGDISLEDRCLAMDIALAPIIGVLEGYSGFLRRFGNNYNGSYGHVGRGSGNFRQNRWGFEYRTPGSWASSPLRALTTLNTVRTAFKLAQDAEWVAKAIEYDRRHDILHKMYDLWPGNMRTQAPYRAGKELLETLWTPYWNRMVGSELLSLCYVMYRMLHKREWETAKNSLTGPHHGGAPPPVSVVWNNFDFSLGVWESLTNRYESMLKTAADQHSTELYNDFIREVVT